MHRLLSFTFRLLAAVVFAVPLAAFGQTLTLTNEIQTHATLTNTTVLMSGRSELRITGTGTPISGCTINLDSADSWLLLTRIKPSVVNTATYLNQIRINGVVAALNTNCRIAQHGDGAVVIPHSSSFAPLTVYRGRYFTDSAMSLTPYTAYNQTSLGAFNDRIRSFKLKRGYTATIAQNPSGTGVSKNYVAQDGDIEVAVLPEELDNSVSFVRVFPWRWTNKKGIAGNIESGLNVNWVYNWNIDRNSALDLEYVPIRQERWWPDLAQDWRVRGSNHLLGYNEPDRPDQSNIAVGDAIWSWTDLLGTGLRVGAPAVSDGGLNWLYSFMDQADAAGLRVDFVPVHYYRCHNPADAAGAASQFYNFLKDIYERTGRPIWITEWNNGANWTACGDPTFAQQQAAIAAMIDMLEETPFVERYALYNWVEDVRAVKAGDGSLTSAGVTYRDKASSLSYTQVIPEVPTPAGAFYRFENDARDNSASGHAAMAKGAATFTAGQRGQAVSMSGDRESADHVLLSPRLGDSADFTFGAWVYWTGGANWQRIFDLGAGTNNYMFLTPSSGSGNLRFAIKDGGNEQQLNHSNALTVNTWTHVAVTISGSTGKLFVNGTLVATNPGMSINPVDLKTTANFLGKSQFSADPYFSGRLDEVQFLPYALADAQVSQMRNSVPPEFSSTIISGGTATQGVAYSATLGNKATDPDIGDVISYSKIDGPAWLNVAANGTLSGTPGFEDEGMQEFVIYATDGAGATAVAILTISLPSISGDGTWVSDGNGTWNDSTKWSSNRPASGIGFTADFSTLNITADRIVTLNASRTIGALRFGDTSGLQSWTLAATSGRTLTLETSSGTPAIAVNQNTASLSAPLAGTDGVTKSGAGTLILRGDNSISNTLNIDTASSSANEGVVRLANPNAASNFATIAIRTNNGGRSTLEFDASSGDITTPAGLTLSGRNNSVVAIRNIAGNNTVSGGLTIGSGGSSYIFQADGGALTITGPVTSTASGSRTLTFQGNGNFLLSGVVQNGSATTGVALVKSGEGTLTLSADNTLTGGVTVNGGAVTVTGSGDLGPGPISFGGVSALTLAGAGNYALSNTVTGPGNITSQQSVTVTGNLSGFTGTFVHNSTTSSVSFNSSTATSASAAYILGSTQGSLQGMIAGGPGDYTLHLGSLSGVANSLFRGGLSATGTVTLQIGGQNTSTTFDGSINDGQKALALTKVGAGTLTLGGSSNYSGPTTISAGGLAVNGSLTGGGALIAANGSTLSGSGSIAGPATIHGTHSPGASVGTQTFGATVAYGNTARLDLELGANSVANGTFDRVAATGAVSIGAGATVNILLNGPGTTVAMNDAFWAQPHTWSILAGSSVSGSFALGSVTTDPAGRNASNYGTLSLQHSSTAVTLVFAPHPPRQVWQRVNFGANWNDASIAGDTADPDQDALTNLLEYALGSDPNAEAAGGTPQVGVANGKLTIAFTRNTAATDVTISVLGADQPGGPWTELARSTAGNPFAVITNGTAVTEEGTAAIRSVGVGDIYRIDDPSHRTRFLRVRFGD